MPLSYQNQMDVLTDILSNHQSDCCGTIAECEQVQRLIKSMLASGTPSHEIQSTLTNIYEYTQAAKNSQHLDDHIQTNQQNLSQWVNELTTLS